MFKSNKWSHKFLTVSALSLSDLIVGVENVTSVSGKVSLTRKFPMAKHHIQLLLLQIIHNNYQHKLNYQSCSNFL